MTAPGVVELLGATSAVQEHRWTADDVMLYALAVGAGQADAASELELTTENSADVALTVLPTFATIITRSARVDLSGVDPTAIVHAEQAFELHRPLPIAGAARVSATVTGVWDKGSGALLTIESRAVDAGTDEPLATSTMSLFVRGAGGFGGDRGPSSSWAVPDGPPDVRTRFSTRPEQALLYRLTGDRNPLHSDPSFAARAGHDRPLLHGMCTYGYLGRLLFQAFCDSDPASFGTMRARFVRPVFPGDELELSAWAADDGVRFTATRGDAAVIGQGLLTTAAPVGAG